MSAFLLLIFVICIPSETYGFKKINNDVPKLVSFDGMGILTINGNVTGSAKMLKRMYNDQMLPGCGFKPYYVFTVCPKNKKAFEKESKSGKGGCSRGIFFCYESQLSKDKVREQFVLPRMENEVSKKCNASNVLKIFPKLALPQFNGFKLALHNNLGNSFEPFKPYLEVDTTFTEEPYFFPLYDNLCLHLELGSKDGILAGISHASGSIKPKKVYYLNKTMGALYKDADGQPDTVYNTHFSAEPHLKFLYLDFRAPYHVTQTMVVIAPDESEGECNMKVKIRTNVPRPRETDYY